MERARPKTGRFAPSPTGRLHAGNIFAYLMAWLDAKASGGRIVLRIEDLDEQRSKPHLADQVMRDLEALGLTWDEGPYRQSARTEAYREALRCLEGADLVYPCFCSRAEAMVQSAPHAGERDSYTGACRDLTGPERAAAAERIAREGRAPSTRVRVHERTIAFDDIYQGPVRDELIPGSDDFIVRRSDGLFAYQLAVVVDDAEQGIDAVVRGQDLLPSTKRQILLQGALGIPTPQYGHVPLLTAADGRRLAKRDADASMDAMAASLGSPEAIIGHIAHLTGLMEESQPVTPEALLPIYDEERLRAEYRRTPTITFTLDQSA